MPYRMRKVLGTMEWRNFEYLYSHGIFRPQPPRQFVSSAVRAKVNLHLLRPMSAIELPNWYYPAPIS